MGDQSAKFDVGYGKPPSEHQFRKGQSGNPKGRPKGKKNKSGPLNPAEQPTDSLVLEEAYRLVTIREGDKVIELPAVQAAVRSLAISAMKGSRLAQRDLAGLVREVEDRRSKEQLTALENAIDYKVKWKAEMARRIGLGIEEPDPIPHPDDIIIDMRTGRVRTEGPLDEREKAEWDARLTRRADAQDEVNYYAQKHRRARSDKLRQLWLEQWHMEQRIFDIINDAMPKRYKARLENRSLAEGASREGMALKEIRKRG